MSADKSVKKETAVVVNPTSNDVVVVPLMRSQLQYGSPVTISGVYNHVVTELHGNHHHKIKETGIQVKISIEFGVTPPDANYVLEVHDPIHGDSLPSANNLPIKVTMQTLNGEPVELTQTQIDSVHTLLSSMENMVSCMFAYVKTDPLTPINNGMNNSPFNQGVTNYQDAHRVVNPRLGRYHVGKVVSCTHTTGESGPSSDIHTITFERRIGYGSVVVVTYKHNK